MAFYGKWETWKIVYIPKEMNGGVRGVALVEAGDKHHAMQTFREGALFILIEYFIESPHSL